MPNRSAGSPAEIREALCASDQQQYEDDQQFGESKRAHKTSPSDPFLRFNLTRADPFSRERSIHRLEHR